MTVKEIYNELQMLDEFHANFNPTCDSKVSYERTHCTTTNF